MTKQTTLTNFQNTKNIEHNLEDQENLIEIDFEKLESLDSKTLREVALEYLNIITEEDKTLFSFSKNEKFTWKDQIPTFKDSNHKDINSIVFLELPLEKYSDEELRKVLYIAKKLTAHYDTYFYTPPNYSYRLGANYWYFNKHTEKYMQGLWKCTKASWRTGMMYFKSLNEALFFIRKSEFELKPIKQKIKKELKRISY